METRDRISGRKTFISRDCKSELVILQVAMDDAEILDPDTGWKICPLCKRPIPPELESKHHLIPKLRGGKNGPIAILHTICHGKIHSVFTETELARNYATVELLLEHEEIQKFVKWVRKRPPEYRSSIRGNHRRKR